MARFPDRLGSFGRALVALALLVGTPAISAPFSVSVKAADGKPLVGAVVTAKPLSGGARPAPIQAAIVQANLAFDPDLLVIPVGSSVDFPNNDTVSHQIYSFSAAKRFQLPLYRGKPYPPVRFDSPGVITLGCNIHDAMLAYIVVTDAAHFGRTDSSGAWIADVPPGKYRVTVWHPRVRDDARSLEREATVSAAGPAAIEISILKALKPAPIEDRPHSWDAY